jgi:hypothetical protein
MVAVPVVRVWNVGVRILVRNIGMWRRSILVRDIGVRTVHMVRMRQVSVIAVVRMRCVAVRRVRMRRVGVVAVVVVCRD